MPYQVKFPAGVATIDKGKWSLPGDSAFAALLDLQTSHLSRGPEIGFDFDWHAATEMASQQGGQVQSPPPPPGTYKTKEGACY